MNRRFNFLPNPAVAVMQIPAQHFNVNIFGLFQLIMQADAPQSGQYNTLLQPNNQSFMGQRN